MRMLRWLLGGAGALLFVGLLSAGLSGCGESAPSSGSVGEVKVAPPVNPAPGAMEPEPASTPPAGKK